MFFLIGSRHSLGCVSSGTIRKLQSGVAFLRHTLKRKINKSGVLSCVSVDWQWNISRKQRTITDISFATPIHSTQRLCIASIRTNSLCIRETQNRVTALGVSRLPCEAKRAAYLSLKCLPAQTCPYSVSHTFPGSSNVETESPFDIALTDRPDIMSLPNTPDHIRALCDNCRTCSSLPHISRLPRMISYCAVYF